MYDNRDNRDYFVQNNCLLLFSKSPNTRLIAELNPCGPLMGGTILLKQGQFVLRGWYAMYMHHWLRPLSLPRLYGIDAYLIRHIPL